jgi:hypothetical protein
MFLVLDSTMHLFLGLLKQRYSFYLATFSKYFTGEDLACWHIVAERWNMLDVGYACMHTCMHGFTQKVTGRSVELLMSNAREQT